MESLENTVQRYSSSSVCNSMCPEGGWLYSCDNMVSAYLNGAWIHMDMAMLLLKSQWWVRMVVCDAACRCVGF